MQNRHHEESKTRAQDAKQREQGQLPAGDSERAGPR